MRSFNPGLTATRIVRIEDVTNDILKGISESLKPKQKDSVVRANMDMILAKAMKDNHYEAEIKAFNYGNDYYMLVKKLF